MASILFETSTSSLLSGAAPFAISETLEPDVEAGQGMKIKSNTTPTAQTETVQTTAILLYLFGGFFTDNFPLVFIICVLLLAFDFWTVKNVSGRLLVGLRWWNDIQPDGTNVWMFESRDPSRPVNPTDSRIFWISLYATVVIWIFFGFFAIFKPSWLLIVVVAITLNLANVIGYTQCDKDAKRKWATGFAASAAASNPSLVGKLFSAGLGRFFS
ncbi:19442_t:CDS:2 [Dentiscutata erythropus]|uniref:Golgi apparatus membrane protein TVP23 n=1 Tax=Dentiscutata erythropus TaxID=1348616 RepID=A0A9N9EJM4_9GLOM|nr:19442_t:CDS:2 [Dentiscutata erythropus]